MGSDLWSDGTGVTSKWAQEYLQYHICHTVTPILFAIAQSIYADTGATLAQSCRYQLYLNTGGLKYSIFSKLTGKWQI